MSRTLVRARQCMVCAAALLCLVTTAFAQGTTRFAGSYQLSAITEESTSVHLTVALTLINPERTEIKGGIVALMDSTPDSLLIGSFSAINTLPAFGHVTIKHTFTITAAEYARWQAGHAPRFQLLLPEGDSAFAADIQAHLSVTPVKAAD